ncbi:hypothetical protein KI387_008113, partial [Taxus chinensis]
LIGQIHDVVGIGVQQTGVTDNSKGKVSTKIRIIIKSAMIIMRGTIKEDMVEVEDTMVDSGVMVVVVDE